MNSLLYYIKLFIETKSLDKVYKKAVKLKQEGKITEKDELVKIETKKWAEKSLSLANSSIEILGRENIPKDEGFLVTPNHDSMFDISAMFITFDRNISFVTKEENKKIPFVSKWLPVLDCISIDRSSPKASVKSLLEGAKMIKNKKILVIFPEGTRTGDGNLGEFKAGSFKIAQKAESKVLPVAICGAREMMRKGSLKINSGHITVSILKPIDTNDINTNELAAKTKAVIQNEIKRIKNIQ